MQNVTLFIAVLGAALVCTLKPAKALCVYLSILMLWPTYLVIQIATLDISAGRIVVLFLLLRCVLTPRIIQQFRISKLDFMMMFFVIVNIVAPILAGAEVVSHLIASSGTVMDTFFAYLAARFCIHTKKDFIFLAKSIALILLPLSLLGLGETFLNYQLYMPLMKYRPWGLPGRGIIEPRFGLTRAIGPSGHAILFGATFAIFIPWIYSLRHESGFWRWGSYCLTFFAVAGVFSSLSSGPWVMLIMILICLWFERHSKLLKPVLWSMGIGACLISILSNRRFYHVISDYANPLGGSAYHRARLIDCAIESFNEWCFFGYGLRDPGWGHSLGMAWTDITNHFIFIAVQSGLPGLLLFVGLLTGLLVKLIKMYRIQGRTDIRSVYWSFCTILVVLFITLNSCTFFSQIRTFLYIVLGVLVSATCSQFPGVALKNPPNKPLSRSNELKEAKRNRAMIL